MKPDPKPVKMEKEKMTSAEFRKKYGGKKIRRKAVKVRRKKSGRQKMIDEADRWFSRRVRLEGADNYGMGRCIDCGTVVEVKYADCGHYYSRRHLSVRWDIDNAHLQKKKCNLEMGRPEINSGYREALYKKIGMSKVALLDVRRFNIFKPTEFDLTLIIEENKARVSYLLHKNKLTKWW